jgi:hypothetical protein
MAMLADQKASILVGVCLVVFTVILSRWTTESMSVALLVLGATAVIAALLAIMAVVPAFRWNLHSRGEPNPLFFGSFAQLSEQEYLDRMRTVIRDEPSVYSAMIRGIYHQGRILYTRKYRFLSYSYRVFAIGLVLTVATAAFDLWRGA